jgi:hypothetical protein
MCRWLVDAAPDTDWLVPLAESKPLRVLLVGATPLLVSIGVNAVRCSGGMAINKVKWL